MQVQFAEVSFPRGSLKGIAINLKKEPRTTFQPKGGRFGKKGTVFKPAVSTDEVADDDLSEIFFSLFIARRSVT